MSLPWNAGFSIRIFARGQKSVWGSQFFGTCVYLNAQNSIWGGQKTVWGSHFGLLPPLNENPGNGVKMTQANVTNSVGPKQLKRKQPDRKDIGPDDLKSVSAPVSEHLHWEFMNCWDIFVHSLSQRSVYLLLSVAYNLRVLYKTYIIFAVAATFCSFCVA